MSTSVEDLMSALDTLVYNPSAIQRAVLQTLTNVSNGTITIVDPTNPFIFALESMAVLTSYAVSKNEVLNRKQYPFAAQDLEDLYLHMSDTDYVNRFAVPATDTFSMMLPYVQLMANMVLDPTTGISQVVIPRNTNITIAGATWSIQYPIMIQQLQHGGLQVVYDTSVASPLQTLPSNIIPWGIVSDGTTEYLKFSFEVMQFQISTLTQSVNASTYFQYQIAYPDQYYYTRVYAENTDGTWTEIQTTYSAEIYDVTTPTAVLQVQDGNVLQITIPQIYTATGVLNSSIRIDIYTTQGQINMALGSYSMAAFVVNFYSTDTNDTTIFTAPLSVLDSIFAWSTDTIAGGSNGVSFAQLRAQVINNSVGPQNIPISNVNLQEALATDGYTVVTSIDNITNRTFLATRALPIPTDSNLVTAAGTTTSTVTFSLDGISGYSYVIDNTTTQNAMTITPNALYQDVNGVVNFVSDAEITLLNNLPPAQLALTATAGGYLYTPFHYVLDSSNNNFAVRPYYLAAPTILTKLFDATNGSTLLQVNTGAYGIVTTPTGYLLQIQTVSNAAYQAIPNDQIFVQLAYVPEGETQLAYLQGTFAGYDSTGKERIFNFDLSSNMNVDAADCIQLTKFLMFTTNPRLCGADLTTNFSILYSTSSVMPSGWVNSSIDPLLGAFLLPKDVSAVTQETLQVQFGVSLNTLWARARSVASTATYETYQVNVPWTYEADVYERDPVTGSAITIVDGVPTYVILHHKGDPVLDALGNPSLQYQVGQIILDAGGQPIIANPRGIQQQVDFMLVEGVYRFATDPGTAAYRTQMIDTLLTWLTGNLETLNQELLEQSQLYFYASTTLGQIEVMVGASQTTTIEAGQSLILTLYVNSSVYNNAPLLAQLESTSIQIVSDGLQNSQVSRTAIEDALMTTYGADVIDAELTGLGGAAVNLPVFTILDNSIRASLRKKLVAQTDNSLVLIEDLTINFVQHDVSAIVTTPV